MSAAINRELHVKLIGPIRYALDRHGMAIAVSIFEHSLSRAPLKCSGKANGSKSALSTRHVLLPKSDRVQTIVLKLGAEGLGQSHRFAL